VVEYAPLLEWESCNSVRSVVQFAGLKADRVVL
jgi:hypothetical protein